MIYRVAGVLFSLFGALQLYGYLASDNQPRTGESGFSSGQYGGLITGVTLVVAGLYLVIHASRKKA